MLFIKICSNKLQTKEEVHTLTHLGTLLRNASLNTDVLQTVRSAIALYLSNPVAYGVQFSDLIKQVAALGRSLCM